MEEGELGELCDMILRRLKRISFAYPVHILLGESSVKGAEVLEIHAVGVRRKSLEVKRTLLNIASKANASVGPSLPVYAEVHPGTRIADYVPLKEDE